MQQAESQKRIKELDGWTNHYYEVVDHYYFRPKQLRPKGNEKLKRYEPALNHMFDLFFHLAPNDLVDDAIGRLVDQSVDGMRPVRLCGLDPNLVQPDVVFFDGQQVIFVEMKIESKSDVGQFVKYAIAAQHVTNLASRFHLVMLVPEPEHEKVWRGEIRSTEDVRNAAQRGIGGDESVWDKGNNAARNYVRKLENQGLESLREIVQSIPLFLKDYGALRQSLLTYLEAEDRNETTQRLVEGMLQELSNRLNFNTSA